MALYVRGAAMSVRTWCRIGRPMPCRVRPDHPCPAARLPKVKLARIELVRPMDVARVHVDRAATVEKEHAVRRDPLQSCRHPARRIYLHRLRKLRSDMHLGSFCQIARISCILTQPSTEWWASSFSSSSCGWTSKKGQCIEIAMKFRMVRRRRVGALHVAI